MSSSKRAGVLVSTFGVFAVGICSVQLTPLTTNGPTTTPAVTFAAATSRVMATPPETCEVVQPVTSRVYSGAFGVIGEARCAGTVALSIFDPSGRFIGIATALTLTRRTGLDGTAAFQVAYSNPPATVGSYSITVRPRIDPTPSPAATCRLAAPVTGRDRGDGVYEVKGEVTCSGTGEATFVSAAAIFYDHAGHPIGTSADLFMQARIPPGGSAPFALQFGSRDDPASTVRAFRVFVDWR